MHATPLDKQIFCQILSSHSGSGVCLQGTSRMPQTLSRAFGVNGHTRGAYPCQFVRIPFAF